MPRTWVDDLEGRPQIAPSSSAIHSLTTCTTRSGGTVARLCRLVAASYFFKRWILMNSWPLGTGMDPNRAGNTTMNSELNQLWEPCFFVVVFFFKNGETTQLQRTPSHYVHIMLCWRLPVCPLLGSMVQLWGYFIHVWVRKYQQYSPLKQETDMVGEFVQVDTSL